MVSRIAAGRKQREIDPAMKALRACMAEAEGDARLHPVAARRLKNMLEFTETMDRWYGQMQGLPKAKLAALINLGTKIASFIPFTKKT